MAGCEPYLHGVSNFQQLGVASGEWRIGRNVHQPEHHGWGGWQSYIGQQRCCECSDYDGHYPDRSEYLHLEHCDYDDGANGHIGHCSAYPDVEHGGGDRVGH